MTKVKAVTAVTPIKIIDAPKVEKTVRISLTQENKAGKQNASFIFAGKGENLTDFLTDTCKKIVGVMAIQERIKANGGKNNVYGLTKSGEFELGITVSDETASTKLLSNFVFSLKSLGSENPESVLVDMVEGYKLLTD